MESLKAYYYAAILQTTLTFLSHLKSRRRGIKCSCQAAAGTFWFMYNKHMLIILTQPLAVAACKYHHETGSYTLMVEIKVSVSKFEITIQLQRWTGTPSVSVLGNTY